MKKFLFLVLIFTVTNSLQAQHVDTIITDNNKNAISYKLILEYGVSTGIERYYDKWQYGEELRTAYSGLGLSLITINNIAFYDRFLLGIGVGIEYRSIMIAFPIELAGTCFLNFRYYFNRPEKVLTPMLNIAIGGRITKDFGVILVGNPWHLSGTRYGIYSTLGAGFKVKLFSLQGGIIFWTKENNLFGVDAMVKVGLNF